MQIDLQETDKSEPAEAGGSASVDLAAALDGLREPLFLCDMLGQVTYANAALGRRLGSAAGEAVLGRHWGPLFVEESRRLIEREGLPAILRDGHWRGRVVLRGAESASPCLLSLSAGRRGGLVGLLGADEFPGEPQPSAGAAAGEDERQAVPDAVFRAEARRLRLDALARLAGHLAHDVNNVLTSILGYARFLVEDLPKDSAQYGFAEQINVAAQRGRRLIEETLAFARPGKGERTAVQVRALVESVCAPLRAEMHPDATLRVQGDGDLAVQAEPALFESVLRHLLANAIEALEGRPGSVEVDWRAAGDLRRLHGLSKPGESLRVTLGSARAEGAAAGDRLLVAAGAPDAAGRFVELVVRDSGAGMDEAVLEQVFEPFFTTRQPASGRGLGLSLVFGQVVGQGGAVLIDSAPGAGTTVRLLWPAPPASVEPQAGGGAAGSDTPPPRRSLPKGQGQRILVAEDDRVLREALGEMLQRLGYKPVLVDDGEVARRVLMEGGAVEAVLTDRRMPNLSGTELIGWMRAENLRQPVLLCTGYGEDLDIAGLTRAGGVLVLSKPIDAATLARSLEEVLAAPVT